MKTDKTGCGDGIWDMNKEGKRIWQVGGSLHTLRVEEIEAELR